MDADILYHGTKGDNILSIARTGQMLPGADGKIFFARYNWANALMHGVDERRKASCVIKVRVWIPPHSVRLYTETRGVSDTLIVHTATPLKAEILEMHVRQLAEQGEPYVFKHLQGLEAIVAWLGRERAGA